MVAPERRKRPPQSQSEESLEGARMTLGEHIEELRTRLIRSLLALALAFVGCWIFHAQLARVALAPLTRAVDWLNADLVELHERRLEKDPGISRSDFFLSDDPQDDRLRDPIRMPRGDSAGSAFVFYMKVCLYFGFFLSGTYILWQLWLFVAAGLYAHEKRMVMRYFPLSVSLFLGGIVFGYFVMVPYAYYFLGAIGLEQVRLDPKLEVYFGFLKSLSLALGIVFQLPVLMIALMRLGLVEPAFFGKYRGHFLILILVVAAILTPPDPFTQMMMAVPMWILYEFGIVLGKLALRRQRETALEAH